MRIARAILGVGVVLVVGLLLVATRTKQDSLPDRLIFPDSVEAVRSSAPSFERSMGLYTQTQFEPGNAVTILLNGDPAFTSLWNDLRSAKRTIFIAQYSVEPGAILDSVGKILAERARSGVRVRLLLDAFGASLVTESWRDSLRASGAIVEAFRPIKWETIFRAARRSHARMFSIDGRIAYAGGLGFADKWRGSGRAPNEWRETSVRVEGPVAEQMQAAFGMAWFEATGELVAGDELFSAPHTTALPGAEAIVQSGPDPMARKQSDTMAAHGGARVGVLHSAPVNGVLGSQRFLAMAIMSAEKNLYISNSYFVPTDELRQLLVRAAQRGVDVRVLTAGKGTDVHVTRSASRSRWNELLAGGVRIFEYGPSMMHAKTIVVDGRWAAIGSMNFDPTSLGFNDEANVILMDPGLAAQMEAVFAADMTVSREITLADIRNRSWRGRFTDWLAMWFERVL
jgi:cardiolipin synthase A/B